MAAQPFHPGGGTLIEIARIAKRTFPDRHEPIHRDRRSLEFPGFAGVPLFPGLTPDDLCGMWTCQDGPGKYVEAGLQGDWRGAGVDLRWPVIGCLPDSHGVTGLHTARPDPSPRQDRHLGHSRKDCSVRRTPARSRCRTALGACGLFLGLFGLVAPASAQVAKAKETTPPPIDTRPLARYVPKNHLYLYLASDGLDAHADAWKKTAAYRMLNETPLGEMLTAVATQLADKALAFSPNRKLSGPTSSTSSSVWRNPGSSSRSTPASPRKGRAPITARSSFAGARGSLSARRLAGYWGRSWARPNTRW